MVMSMSLMVRFTVLAGNVADMMVPMGTDRRSEQKNGRKDSAQKESDPRRAHGRNRQKQLSRDELPLMDRNKEAATEGRRATRWDKVRWEGNSTDVEL